MKMTESRFTAQSADRETECGLWFCGKGPKTETKGSRSLRYWAVRGEGIKKTFFCTDCYKREDEKAQEFDRWENYRHLRRILDSKHPIDERILKYQDENRSPVTYNNLDEAKSDYLNYLLYDKWKQEQNLTQNQ